MNECINLATLLGYAAAILLGLLVLGLLATLVYLARRLRISIRLADEKADVKGGIETAVETPSAAITAQRRKAKAKAKPAASSATRSEILIGILLIGVAAVAVGLLIGIVI